MQAVDHAKLLKRGHQIFDPIHPRDAVPRLAFARGLPLLSYQQALATAKPARATGPRRVGRPPAGLAGTRPVGWSASPVLAETSRPRYDRATFLDINKLVIVNLALRLDELIATRGIPDEILLMYPDAAQRL